VALEADDYSKLPPSTFVQGFIKNYAKFLKLDSEKVLAVFCLEFSDKKHKPYVMDAFVSTVEKPRLTPAKVLWAVVLLIVLSFFGYLWIQYRQFVGAPALSLTAPSDQMTIDIPELKVEGKTDPEVKVSVNSQNIPVSPDGSFSESITLSSQVNKITITASSKFGQKTTIERTVYLKR